ncbi:MAG: glycosyltransferase family 39 protein [Nanoarchaeota archaeon]
MPEQEIKRDEKLKLWLKNGSNLILVVIIIFAVILRLYYFSLTAHQPLWWDESEYLSAAKNYAGIAPYELSSQRLPGYPLLVSLFFKIGISNEVLLRFLLNFLPSLIVIFLVYLCIKEMYPDKRLALISMLLLVVLWEHLFYSNRFQTENLALLFQFLAIFVLFKVYMKKNSLSFIKPKYSLAWIALFSLISVLLRPGNMMFLPPLFLFILILNKSKVFSKKMIPLWILAAALVTLFFLFLPSIPKTGLFSYYHPESKFAWGNLLVFKNLYGSVVSFIPSIFYYSLLSGFLVIIYELFLYWDQVKKISVGSEGLETKSNIFNIFLLVFVLFYFIFILRPASYELRWFFPFLPAMLFFTSKGIVSFSDLIGQFFSSKKLSLLIIIILVLLGAYTQIVHADSIIKIKLDSYSQIRDASLWMKENSNPGDVVFSRSLPQSTYYSERKVYSHSTMNESQFLELVSQTHPKFMLESVLEPHPASWGFNTPESLNSLLIPRKIFFMDVAQTEPVAVVYEFNYTS